MKNLFISYLYKLRHDLAFKITLIIGGGLALFLSLIYFGISFIRVDDVLSNDVNGQSMLIASLSPGNNFGLAVPVNLITFTVLEFNQGSIRNKIIAGHSKANIYTSLVINGLVFTFVLMIAYALLCFGLGSIFGQITKAILENMKNDEIAQYGSSTIYPDVTFMYSSEYVLKYIVLSAFCFVSIVSFTIFFSALFRNIGPSIPVVILILEFMASLAPIIALFLNDNEGLLWAIRIIDPMYGISEAALAGGASSVLNLDGPTIDNETFISGICSNVFYAAAFYLGGLFIFKKRDVK